MTGHGQPATGVGGEGGPPAKTSSMQALVESIMDASPLVRFAAVVGLDGRIAAGILRSGGVPLGPRRAAERLCREAARHRLLRERFDASLGRVSYVHVERETASLFAVHHPGLTVCLTVEPEAPIGAKIGLVDMVRGLAEDACGGGAARRP